LPILGGWVKQRSPFTISFISQHDALYFFRAGLDAGFEMEGKQVSSCFYIAFEMVQNGLPALLLHFQGMGAFRFKSLGYRRSTGHFRKFDPHLAPIAHGIGNYLLRFDFIISAAEIKAEASVLGFHPGHKAASFTKVILRFSGVPIIRSMVPLEN